MARQKNYDQKIATLKEKIATKTEQLKNLRKELTELEQAAAQSKIQEIADLINEKNIDPAEALKALHERF
ncbi:MAG: hypothetical protein E7200_09150 [Selenomonas ruminantium]|jgi:chromosome segregation ATPase|nr:hypothetical protein [Selenomonas ruminantium]